MGVCEPGQGGNAAAISNTFMCLGEPPRLSPASARESSAVGSADARRARSEPMRVRRESASRSGDRPENTVQVRHDGARPSGPTSGSKTERVRSIAGRSRRPRCRVAAARLREPYTVVARRYRPQRFEDVVGQDHVVQALAQRDPAEPDRPGLPVLRDARGRQDVDGPDLRQVPELREGADRGAVPDLRHLPGDRAGPGRRRHRDRRCQQQRRRAGARAAAERRRCGPAGRGSRSTTSTKCTCSRPGPSTPC